MFFLNYQDTKRHSLSPTSHLTLEGNEPAPFDGLSLGTALGLEGPGQHPASPKPTKLLPSDRTDPGFLRHGGTQTALLGHAPGPQSSPGGPIPGLCTQPCSVDASPIPSSQVRKLRHGEMTRCARVHRRNWDCSRQPMPRPGLPYRGNVAPEV